MRQKSNNTDAHETVTDYGAHLLACKECDPAEHYHCAEAKNILYRLHIVFNKSGEQVQCVERITDGTPPEPSAFGQQERRQ